MFGRSRFPAAIAVGSAVPLSSATLHVAPKGSERCRYSTSILVTIFAPGLMCLVAPLNAQDIPTTSEPGSIERQFEEPPQPREQPDVLVPDIRADSSRPANADSISFVLRDFQIEGDTEFSINFPIDAFKENVGKSVTMGQVYDYTTRVKNAYTNEGYILAEVLAFVQPEDGRVTVRVIEGRVGKVTFQGDKIRRRNLLQKIANRIESYPSLRSRDLERQLLLINDLAGVSATATLMPSEAGVRDIVITLREDRLEFDIGVRNRASELLGPEHGEVNLRFNSLLGAYDSTDIRYITSGDELLQYLSFHHSQVLTSGGLRLEITGSASRSEPDLGDAFAPFNLETSTDTASIGLSYPIMRGREKNLYFRMRLTYHDGLTDDQGLDLTADTIAALRVGLTFDSIDTWLGGGFNIADLKVSQGLAIFGASELDDPLASRSGGHPEFTTASLYMARLQALSQRWSLLFAARGQYAFRNVLAPEEFAYGGEFFGRAYDASELVGDHGYAGKLELRFTAGSPRNSATLYAFYDAGEVIQRFGPGDVGSKPERESATAAGIGLRFTIAGVITGYVEAAEPLDRIVAAEGTDDTRVFAGIKINF